MSEKFICAMAGYDEATERYFSQIQQKLYDSGFAGRHTRGLPQHITLGAFPVEMEQELVERLSQVAQRTRAFELSFNHVGVFQGGQVLFLAPDTNVELLELKQNFGDSRGWTAHTTMLIDDTPGIIRALPLVLDAFSAYTGRVTALHLYEFFPARHILSVEMGA